MRPAPPRAPRRGERPAPTRAGRAAPAPAPPGCSGSDPRSAGPGPAQPTCPGAAGRRSAAAEPGPSPALRPSRTAAPAAPARNRTRVSAVPAPPAMAAHGHSRSVRYSAVSPVTAASPGSRSAGEPTLDSDSEPDSDATLECSWWFDEESDEEQGGSAPWPAEPGQPSAAAVLLERCVDTGVVSQETLDLTCRRKPCFVKFSEMEERVNKEAEINEIKLKTEMMQLENETADITHHFYLGKKCEILQDMNSHLETILKEKRELRKRLIKHRCQESLPIEATFHKCIVELFTEAVTFIEKLESHLQSVRSIPLIPHMMNNMDTTLSKTEMLMIELEELTEQILKWKELQKEVYSKNVCNTADLDFGLSLTNHFPQQE